MALGAKGIIFAWLCQNLLVLVSSQQAGTIIPLYIYPQANGNAWQRLFDANKAHPNVPVWAIINPDSGPGNAKNSEYVDGIQRLTDAGIDVMAYVRTTYGNRLESEVKAEIDTYLSYYGPSITGIFFDEMNYTATESRGRRRPKKKSSSASYYSSLDRYAKSKGIRHTVGNPGTDTKPEYVNTVDTIIIYESAGFPAASRYEGWHKNYPREKWGILPHTVPSLDAAKVRQAKSSVQWIFVTDDVMDNPWDTLPPYLTSLFAILDES